MPVITSSIETFTHNLKTCEGGWFKYRRLTFGESMQRKGLMTFEMVTKKGAHDATARLALGNEKILLFEFSKCIVDHNLEVAKGQKFNFSDPSHVSMLDPRIAEEIESVLNAVNNFEDTEEAKN